MTLSVNSVKMMLRSVSLIPNKFTLEYCIHCLRRRIYTSSCNPMVKSYRIPRSDGNEERARKDTMSLFHHSYRGNRPTGFGTRSYSDVAEGEARSINPAANIQSKIFYFDTHALVKKLQSKGFTDDQSLAVTEAFQEVLQSSIDHQIKTMVTKSQQEISVQQMMAHIASVKKDMVILEKSEFSMLRNETEKQSMEIEQLKKNLQNELSKLRGNITLDINLEKSRAIEAHALNQKDLQVLHNKVDTEIANLRTVYEKYRNDVFKYASGMALTAGAMTVGLLRLLF